MRSARRRGNGLRNTARRSNKIKGLRRASGGWLDLSGEAGERVGRVCFEGENGKDGYTGGMMDGNNGKEDG